MTRRLLAAITILAAAGSIANAQQFADAEQLWISASQLRSSHHLIPSPHGLGAGLTFPIGQRFALRVGYHRLNDEHTRVGAVCGGFILDPSECVEERINDSGTLNGFVVSGVGTVARRGRVSFALLPSLSLVTARAVSRGQETGRWLSASNFMVGVGGGAELSILPRVGWPVAFHLGAQLAAVNNATPSGLDGWSPFDAGFRTARVELAASIWKPGRATETKRARSE